MPSRVPNQGEGNIASLFDLASLPFTMNFPQPSMFPGGSSPVGMDNSAGTGNASSSSRPLHVMTHIAPVGSTPGLVPDAGQAAHAATTASEATQDDRKHECELCGKRYKHRTHLTRHLRTHTGEKPFSCNLCGKTFARREYLNMHVSVHQGQATADINFLQCEHCNKKFTRQQVLDKHMEFHSPARRFDCPTCGLRFKTRPALAAQVAAHTASRPYVCRS